MKILLVNKFLYPNGGSETYVFEVGRQLEKMGNEVQYFGMEHEGRIVGNHAESYTSNMDFHSGKLAKFLYPFKIIYSVEARRKIREVLEDFEPDVVHLNNFNFQLTPSIIYEIKKFEKRKKKHIRLIFTAHDYQIVCPNHMMRIPSKKENCERCLRGDYRNCLKYNCIHNSKVKSIIGSLEGWFYRILRVYRHLDCIICPSYFIEKKLIINPLLVGKTIVMHNFVNAVKETETGKKEFVLYFGRFSEEKGIGTLLSVCAKLPDIPFVFAGSGPLEQKVNEEGNVLNVGFMSGDALSRLISEAKFSVYPSEWYENCPFSVMESITYNTPVIGADIGGIPELIEQGITGDLFSSGNIDDLYEKIRQLWNDKSRLSEYTKNCQMKRFDDVEEYCEKLLLLYEGK